MRSCLVVAVLTLLWTAVGSGEEPPASKPKKPPPPPPGIHWEADLQAGLQRAAREGRPVLFAINALENEGANNYLASQAYRSAAWGNATRAYVAFACNPTDHGGGQGGCSRYVGGTCTTHRAALRYFTKRFGEELISPQHVILEPDGDLAYRKEYYTRVVSPILLDSYLSKLAPNAAYARAGIGRQARLKSLANVPLEQLDSKAAAWLDGSDGLAAAAILNVLDDTFDDERRKALIAALRHTPSVQVPVLTMAAEEVVFAPADDLAITKAWLRTLFETDRTAGVWGATRALVRLEREVDREAVLRIWAGKDSASTAPGINDLPATERPAAYEALILAGDRRARTAKPAAGWTRGREAEIERAKRKRGEMTVGEVGLEEALSDAPPGRLRRALLRAPPEEIRRHVDGVVRALGTQRPFRVRVAAALALLKARAASAQTHLVIRTLFAAFDDTFEARDARSAAVRILGSDPGQARTEWQRVLEERMKEAGGAR